jgi:hypothetical protein
MSDPVPESEGLLFLSDEWVEAADRALSALGPVDAPGAVTIEYRVDGAPGGTVRHQLTLGRDGLRVHRPSAVAAVTFTMGWEVAVAVSRGELSAQAAVLDGRIAVAGDPSVLLAHGAELAAVDDALAPLRAITVTTT